MTKRERLQFFFIWLGLGLVPLLLRPLWEPDEARYSEIPREMLALGDWLTPKLNFVLYFEKPPLQYWLSAASMKAFGVNVIAPRLPLALATALSMGAAFVLAKRLGARRPIWAAFMTASCLLGFICGQILTLDALFSAFLVSAFALMVEAVAARMEGRPALGFTLGAFFAMALALLTKGLAAPVLLGGIFVVSLIFAWREEALRRALLHTLFDPWGWLLFLASAVPWFWLVEKANPGHAQFFFIHEHFARFTTTVHARQGAHNAFADKLYFVGVLAAGLLPWLGSAVRGLKGATPFALGRGPQGPKAPLHRWIVGTSLLAILVPLAFFSVSHSKLPPYILPVVVPLMALACALEREGDEARALRIHALELLFLGALFGLAAPFLLPGGTALPWVLAVGLAFLGLGFWALRPKGLTQNRWMAALSGSLLLLTLAAQAAVGRDKSSDHLVKQAPPSAQWMSVGYYFQNIPFRTGHRAVIVAGTGELAYGAERLPAEERNFWFRENLHDLMPAARALQAADASRPVFALFDASIWPHLTAEERGAWDVVDRTRTTYLARLR